MRDIIVVDTNVFINAIFDRKNFPNDMRLLRLESEGKVQLAFSTYTANELFKIVSRRVQEEDIFDCSQFYIMLTNVFQRSIVIDIPDPTDIITNRSDQNFVDLAVEVKANYLVTNDIESGILQSKNLNDVTFHTPFQYIHNYFIRLNTTKSIT